MSYEGSCDDQAAGAHQAPEYLVPYNQAKAKRRIWGPCLLQSIIVCMYVPHLHSQS